MNSSRACTLNQAAVLVAYIFVFSSSGEAQQPDSPASRLTPEQLQDITEWIADRSPPSSIVATRDLYGEAVDCLDFFAQPAVRRLLEQGVDVPLPTDDEQQQEPLSPPNFGASNAGGPVLETPCPRGSVATKRITVDEIAAYGSLEKYLNRPRPWLDFHEYATARQTVNNFGAYGKFNIWTPAVPADDFSLAQMWVARGSGSNLETLEAGYIKWGSRAGNSRLFVYFTANNYGPGSCWNDDCGYIKTSQSVVLDGQFSPVSTAGGTQWEYPFQISKLNTSADWVFGFNGVQSGYWRRSLFDTNGVADNAAVVEWGGETWDYADAGNTTADMGSGQFPNNPDVGNFGYVPWIANMTYTDTFGAGWDASLTTSAPTPGCYRVESFFNAGGPRTYIYFGGTGYDPTNCP